MVLDRAYESRPGKHRFGPGGSRVADREVLGRTHAKSSRAEPGWVDSFEFLMTWGAL